jgi:hypothetical protein
MQRFYFHQRANGRLLEDQLGLQFATSDEARAHAMHLTPAILRRIVRATDANTYLSTEVSDGTRTLCVIRGTVIIERR